MKHSYLQSGIFHAFQTLGIFLTSLTLLTSCSNELEGFPTEKEEEANSNIASSKEDSVLRFLTIDELENISVSDIPGDHDGFELKELSYQCVDTIELRALRFDVTAKLCSSANQEKVISFTAEVGPELISVEYYPGGEMIPAHHNLATAFYPKVERYRNYSDGSRIGPDEFYDYGHFVGLNLGYNWQDGDPSIIKTETLTPYWIEGEINPEVEFYRDGVFNAYGKILFEYNLNTKEIGGNGANFSGEDYFHKNLYRKEYLPSPREDTKEMVGNYYSSWYIPSRICDPEDEEIIEIMNLCSKVPDVSPSPFPEDTRSLANGWYFGAATDERGYDYFLYSNRDLYLEADWSKHIGITKGFPLIYGIYIYLQYLIIDGRIINFEQIALNDYPGVLNIAPKINSKKTSEGYIVKLENETKLYGEKFKTTVEIEMKGTYGPEQTFDYTSYTSIENKDQDELENLNSINKIKRSTSLDKRIEREDGKSISINRSLPQSLRSIKNTRTISSFDK